MSKVTLKVGHLPIIDHIILGMTKAKVESQMESLTHSDIETQQMFSWNEVGGALMKGTIDVAFMLAPYAMDIFHAKKNVKLVLLSHRSGSVIVANKAANVETINDFRGKTILIPYQASVHQMILTILLKSVGMSIGIGKDVMTEVVAPGQIPMMIEYDQEGIIGGYIVAEPFGTMVTQSGRGKLLKLSKEVWNEHPCCAVVVRDEIVQKHPEAIQELVTSLVKSGEEVKTNLDFAVNVGMKFMNQEESVVRAILSDPKERVSTNRLMPKMDEFEAIQDYLTTKVSVPAISGKIEMDKFVDLTFAKNANAK